MFKVGPSQRAPKTTLGYIRVERDGWFIDIETLDVAQRPNWEIRCLISRSREESQEQRRHRFYVSPELSEEIGLAKLPETRRQEQMERGAKRVILRELEAIFAEPEEGLDSVRPLRAIDLKP